MKILILKHHVKNHNLAKYILDAAWSKLVTYTSYKAENAGTKDLSERIHNCPFCGLSIDHDFNVSNNTLRLRLQSVSKA